MDRLRIGALMLAPGAIVFSLRAALELVGRDPSGIAWLGPLTAIGGALSLVGLAVVVWALGAVAVAGAACVLVGHFVLSPTAPDLGAGLVYLGTGLAVASRRSAAAAAGAVAMAGALARGGTPVGHALVAIGAAWLAWQLLLMRADMNRQS